MEAVTPDTVVAVSLLSGGSVATFVSGLLVGRHWPMKELPEHHLEPPPPPTRWNNPADFKCPVCQHAPKQHYSRNDWEYPRRILGVEIARMGCGERGCLCGQTQEQMMTAAEKWSFEPPSASALIDL